MRKLVTLVAALVLAWPFASASKEVPGLTVLKDPDRAGYTTYFTSSTEAGVYYIGTAFPIAVLDFEFGSGFSAVLYACDTPDGAGDDDLSDDGECVSLATLSTADLTVDPLKAKKLWYVLDINTAGTATLTIKGTWDQVTSIGTASDCASGNVKGGGYDATTGRYSWTCGNYNWHGDADPTQASASYFVDCTGDGTGTYANGGGDAGADAYSCLRSGERRLIGALHRVGMAVDRTKDGGVVFLPNFEGYDHGIYVDDGCGTLSDGTTRAECPPYYDPDIEGLSWFADSGHAWIRGVIRAQRGVTIIGEGRPAIQESDTNTPKLSGVWFIDDRGADPTTDAPTITEDGPSSNIDPPTHRFGTGWNGFLGFCSTTGNSIACQNQPDDKDWLDAPFSAYANVSSLLTDPTYNAGSVDVCIDNAVASTGTCSLDRRYAATAADDTRTNGGCNASEQDLGDGQGFVDAMEADVAAGKNLVIGFELSRCEDDPASSADCAGNANWFFADVKEFRATTCGAGSAGRLVRLGVINDGAGYAGRNIWAFPDIDYFAGGGTNIVYAIDAERVTRDSGTIQSVGAMPANFHFRDSATNAADCLSGGTAGGDPDSSDDEQECDGAPLWGMMAGFHGKLDGVVTAYGSSGNKSNLDGSAACIGCELTNSFYTANRRGIWSDPSSWYYHGNVWAQNNNAATGASRGFNVFASGFVIDGDEFFANDVAQLVTIGASNNSRRNRFVNLKIRQVITQSALFEVLGGSGHLIENVDAYGVQGGLLKVAIDSSRVVMGGLTLRNNRFSGRAAQGTTPDAAIEFQSNNFAGERTGPILISNNEIEMAENDAMLVYFEPDENASGELDESRGQIQLIGNRFRNPDGDGCLFAIGDRDQTGVENCASSSPAVTTAWGGTNHKLGDRWLPYVLGNELNGIAAPDFPYRTIPAAEAEDANDLPDGTVYAIGDDDLSVPCSDTSGVLDGNDGDPTLNLCQSSSAGSWNEF